MAEQNVHPCDLVLSSQEQKIFNIGECFVNKIPEFFIEHASALVVQNKVRNRVGAIILEGWSLFLSLFPPISFTYP